MISIIALSTRTQKINLFNKQDLDIDTDCLKQFLYDLSDRLEVFIGFSVMLVTDKMMKDYNHRFAGQDTTTDVLAFPCEQDWISETLYAGDIIISVQAAQRQAKGLLLNEVKILSLHGFLHLLGYEHGSGDEKMFLLEEKLRKEFSLS